MTNLIENRIEKNEYCKYIDLTEKEKELYKSCGWHIARFVDGDLKELYSLSDFPADFSEGDIVMTVFNRTLRTEGEHWLVMCSDFSLCHPYKLNMDNDHDFDAVADAAYKTKMLNYEV